MGQKKQAIAGRYVDELDRCLRRQGFETSREQDGSVKAFFHQEKLCHFYLDGGFSYWDKEDAEWKSAIKQASGTAKSVSAYMKLMEQAPPLKADDLEGDYRLLFEFNGTVMASHPTEYGVQFITWDWTYGHTGLWQGHYHMEDYEKAK